MWNYVKIFLAVKVFFASIMVHATNQDPLILFLEKMSEEHFPNCGALHVEKVETQNSRSFIQAVNLGKYVLNFPREINSTDFSYPKHMFNIKRHSESCMIHFISVKSVTAGFINLLKEIVTPTFMPIARKDRDHFVFIADPSIHAILLTEKVFVSKIKFKIAIGLNPENQLQVTTVSLFGGPNGSPQVFPLKNYFNHKIDIFPDFVWNLNGHTLQISIPFARSFLEVDPGPRKQWDGINNANRGHWKTLFEDYLMVKFNFTYRMFPATDNDGKVGSGRTGLLLPNGTWVGMTGDLYYGRADLGLIIANTDIRTQYIGFTDTTFDTGALTFVTGPAAKVYSTLAIFWPFTLDLWLLLLISLVGGLGFFCIVTKFLIKCRLESRAMNLSTQVLIVLMPFLEQDYPTELSTSSLRCFIAFWSFFSMIMTNLFKSKLVTLLAFPVLGTLPKTFDELAFSDYQVGFMKNGDSAYSTLSRSEDPVYVSLVKRMEIFKGVNLTCLQRIVQREKYACIAYDFDIVFLQQKNFSDENARKLTFTDAKTYNIWLGLATQAHSLYRINFETILGRTMPFALADIWSRMDTYETIRKPKLKWWEESNLTQVMLQSSGADDDGEELTLHNIKGVFYIFFYCVIICCFAFLNEVKKLPCNPKIG